MDLENLKYPIGKYQSVEVTDEVFNNQISTIEKFPCELKKLVSTLSYNELDFQYRRDSWNIKQIVHHMADSHMNGFIRFKWVLTEENPTIRPYLEKEWGKLTDASNEEITDSLEILEGLHRRWTTLLRSLDPQDRKRTFVHPKYNEQFTLEWMLGLYDWHCRHHLAHIQQAIEKEEDS